MIIALPNEWAKLPPAELHARANTIAQTAVGKATDLQWAVHWNHARSICISMSFSLNGKGKRTQGGGIGIFT